MDFTLTNVILILQMVVSGVDERMSIMNKNKHLSFEERKTIAERLTEGASFKAISKELGRDCTTISKEVRKHTTTRQTGAMGSPYNNCKYRRTCRETWICHECTSRKLGHHCRHCYKCNSICPKYEPFSCPKLLKPPYVCNNCSDNHFRCTLEKHFYIAKDAQKEYEYTLHEARTGINLTEEEVKHLDQLFSPLIKKQQSIHHICVNHRDSVMVSESTIYRLVDYNLFEARNIDMPRRVRFAPRKKRKDYKVDKKCRIGRSLEDYKNFIKEYPNLPITQMDSVEGRKGGKVLLTIHFIQAECMLAFLRDTNDSKSVIDNINRLYKELGSETFCSIMPILLGDNGSEFSNPTAIEFDQNGNQRTHVFYCDPSAPGQKGSCERNHEFIRMFIPKGHSLDDFTQDMIDEMMNNINSYGRPSLGDKCPYEMMAFMYGDEAPKALGMKRIAPDDVTLNASIWGKEDVSNENRL